ncbi:hypothetical protein HPB50_006523 [Hyalomma asiaticum]|uniref:Uncharacterized protein n=1 Tax=Hyalomma asiaticum TaxID=266040 RepID=A0ACB7RTK1_HYAAI|nr:hypothetical protein HPB50_006523 [Hyalomma asiaticum]
MRVWAGLTGIDGHNYITVHRMNVAECLITTQAALGAYVSVVGDVIQALQEDLECLRLSGAEFKDLSPSFPERGGLRLSGAGFEDPFPSLPDKKNCGLRLRRAGSEDPLSSVSSPALEFWAFNEESAYATDRLVIGSTRVFTRCRHEATAPQIPCDGRGDQFHNLTVTDGLIFGLPAASTTPTAPGVHLYSWRIDLPFRGHGNSALRTSPIHRLFTMQSEDVVTNLGPNTRSENLVDLETLP